jgi:phage terminase large subunit-like protein
MGVRLGDDPQIVYASTPRPTARIREMIADPDTVVTRGSTYDNARNLAPAFLAAMRKKYEGTRLGDQELRGLVLDKVEGALWSMDLIAAHRVDVAPSFAKVVVAVDPAMTSGPDADETGIIAVGRGHDGHGYVIADRSGRYGVTEWPRVAADLAVELGAACLHVEDNTLKDAMGPVMRAAGVTLPVRAITAYKSKEMRATPVVMLYEQGRMHHVDELLELEAEMTSWVPTRGKSPNRIDAMVHAATELRLIQPLPDTPSAPRPRRIAPPRTI